MPVLLSLPPPGAIINFPTDKVIEFGAQIKVK